MKTTSKLTVLSVLLVLLIAFESYGQLPLVYNSENTGSNCNMPPLPDPGDLQNIPKLPDPFAWSNGIGRSTQFSDWECRRNEIKAEIQEYEIGLKPIAPADITASYADGVLTVNVMKDGETLTLTSQVTMPEGDGPFPVVIGMNSATGSLPDSLFEGVIKIPFMHNQVVSYSQGSRNPDDPYFKLYPEFHPDEDTYLMGNYSAWSWGVSRLIDGIAMVQDQLRADVSHIAVTGCSYAGKMALFAGAFDERIALTIAQESGGGGAPAWRVSETIGNVEKIDNTNYSWFLPNMGAKFDGRVGILPHDHHELMAMVAPRALLITGNTSYEWLANPSAYVSARATEEVYKALGIEDRFGFYIDGDHNHCAIPESEQPSIRAFVDKFLFDDTSAETEIRVNPYGDTVDYRSWISGWTDTDPNTPNIMINSPEDNATFEAPATVTITATVSDENDDVQKVEFFNGAELLGEDADAPYAFTWENLEGGTYQLSAKATDAQGLLGYSNVIKITVTTPPSSVYKVTTPPEIDGMIDDLWENAKINVLEAENVLLGDSIEETDLSGIAKVIWDDTFMYILAEVTDDIKLNDSPNAIYQDDNIEIYLDGNNGKTNTYEPGNDVQYTFRWDDGDFVGTSNGISTEGIAYVMQGTDTGYIFEAKIPLANLGITTEDGMMIGFDFMINDDDDGGDRDAKLSWHATNDSAYQNTSVFGTVVLAGETLSIGDIIENQNIMVYPNPSKNVLLIKGVEHQFNYEIINAAGNKVHSGKANKSINIEHLAQGVYFLKIINKQKSGTMKFIKG
ncbi:sugar-binding protein [Flavimarina sp. Hel_I_48]|uniref:glucuronyl esterase domain-containing protein n=1 Tax=Flavimarina sp. Hel_I_48 TaxID=1392488 RepID=UPI0009DE97BA|nr:sugar-binding protein [Flavimarina sp. Hel_I_48]